jgi:methyltransferase
MNVNAEVFALAVIIGLMLAETRVSMKNEAALRALGAVAPPGDVYLILSIVYPAAFVVMGMEGLWRASHLVPMVAPTAAPSWFAAGVLLMVASKGLKYWAIAHLGQRWTFKVLVLPGAPLVRTGPYRYVNHPNYIAVFGELAATALMMTAWISGPLMTLAFALTLRARLAVEVRALRNSGQEW